MSNLLLRHLAEACAARLAGKVQTAVNKVVEQELAGTIQDILREQYPGESFKVYVAKRAGGTRKERDDAIRAEYNGRNAKELMVKYSVSRAQFFRVVSRA